MNNDIIEPMKLSEIETKHTAERFWSKVDKTGECWLWRGWQRSDYGYGGFGVKQRGRWRSINAHRMAYLLEYGEVPDDLEVCHRCDIPNCVNPKHLFLGTHEENMQDAVAKGRLDNSGERNGRGKLRKEEVIEIRSRHLEPVKNLAADYKLKVVQVYRILQNKSWYDPKYVPEESRYRHWTKEEVKDVHSRRERGETLKSIAESYGVDHTRIWQIAKGD